MDCHDSALVFGETLPHRSDAAMLYAALSAAEMSDQHLRRSQDAIEAVRQRSPPRTWTPDSRIG